MSTQENVTKLRELINKYPNNLKVIKSEIMVDLIDMDAVIKAGTAGMSDYKNDDSAGPHFISKQLTSGKDVAIVPKGKDSILIFAANGLFKKGW
jgi:hypothetical protein